LLSPTPKEASKFSAFPMISRRSQFSRKDVDVVVAFFVALSL
jgi:hypothetical protein